MSDAAPLHVDNHLLVVDKPACLPVVPDASGDDSLLDLWKSWVKEEYGKPGNVFLGVVHRLDRPVSGIVVFARTSKAAERLAKQWRERTVEKRYLAVVHGRPREPEGEIEQWLLKDSERNVVRVVAEPTPGERASGAKRAVTKWRTQREEEVDGRARTLLGLEPVTGRAHQLRVACRAVGCPIEGDLKYGADAPLPDRSIALHAESLSFDHPTRAERLTFQARIPKRLSDLLGTR